MEPAVVRLHGRETLVKPEGAPVALRVRRIAIGRDVVGTRPVGYGRQARRMELQHLLEPGPVDGPSVLGSHVMSAVGRRAAGPPVLAPSREVVVGTGGVVAHPVGHVGNPHRFRPGLQALDAFSDRSRLILADIIPVGIPGVDPDGAPALRPIPAPRPFFQQRAQAAELQIPRGPGPRRAVGLRVVQDVDVVDHHVPRLRFHRPELVPAVPPQRLHRSLGQGTQPVAARQKMNRIVPVPVEGNSQAVHRVPGRVQSDVLVRPHRHAHRRRLDQHVLPGQHRVVPREQSVHHFPNLPAAQRRDELAVLIQGIQQLHRHAVARAHQVIGGRVFVQRPQGQRGQPGSDVGVNHPRQVDESVPIQVRFPAGFRHHSSQCDSGASARSAPASPGTGLRMLQPRHRSCSR